MKFKLDKNKSKKIVALALATTITTGVLSGCNSKSKDNLLDGTILENTRVITFEDGHIDIATEINGRYLDLKSKEHNHYKSIITNEEFAPLECESSSIYYKYEITTDESIVAYLTPEEIVKFTNEEVTSEDVKNILLRIFTEHEETKETTKTK